MKNHVVFVENFLSREECLSLRYENGWEPAHVGSERNGDLKESVRKSKVQWLTSFSHPDIYIKVSNLINEANETTFKYNLNVLPPLQLTSYNGEEEGFYKTHRDSYVTKLEDTNDRKLSVSVLLSDPSEYEGGELFINSVENEWTSVPKKTGSAVIFSSYQLHEVKKVLKGNRYSLVAWAEGPVFR